jgi:beta-lactamase superfamily II metal-dependent hydrolase
VPEKKPVKDEDLLFHILNVGDGDNIVVEFPKDEATDERFYGIIDCYDGEKTIGYLDMCKDVRPARDQLEFICATHPHKDHVDGIDELLNDDALRPKEFWDCGFRHNIERYQNILKTLKCKNVSMTRVSSGMEKYYGKVQVTILAPSVALRNRYNTYGVDVNNASIVLRFEHHRQNVLGMRSMEYVGGESLELVRDANPATAIFTGDAEFESWSRIVEEFPHVKKTSAHKPLVVKMINYLNCHLVKVAHHGSMHSAPLDIYEIMTPKKAVISALQKTSENKTKGLEREMFPHASAEIALEESGAEVLSTQGSYDFLKGIDGKRKKSEVATPGSIVVVVPPGGSPRWIKLDDDIDYLPTSIPVQI